MYYIIWLQYTLCTVILLIHIAIEWLHIEGVNAYILHPLGNAIGGSEFLLRVTTAL